MSHNIAEQILQLEKSNITGLCPVDKCDTLNISFKQELSGTKAYKETSEEEKSVVNGHCNHLALTFSVCVKERQDRLGFLLLQCSSGVVRHPRDLQVSVATRFCPVLIFASS